ncbi:hypothetical protein [Amycolatopsis sp. CA-230715]|uniref:hypothetical protein n=1 Tax=Amycolatopsis sp. CA-230715 TaxID=2745196 RepID=UPI001C0361BC|nr:hypothetical protein [Amycolatopsis sp. CA-230715]
MRIRTPFAQTHTDGPATVLVAVAAAPGCALVAPWLCCAVTRGAALCGADGDACAAETLPDAKAATATGATSADNAALLAYFDAASTTISLFLYL